MARKSLPPDRLRTKAKVPSAVERALEEQQMAWWYVDAESDRLLSLHRVADVILDRTSAHQRVQVVDLEEGGRALILDGDVQLASADEHIYHEMFVHPAVAWGQPESVLVLGGGDGCLLRELLKWGCIERVLVVELDPVVVAASREFCPDWSAGAFEDPRVELVHRDALEVLELEEEFDLVLADLTEPNVASGLSSELFTARFFERIRSRLTEGGLFATQTGGVRVGQPAFNESHARIVNDIREAFGDVRVAYEYVPSFRATWTVTFASPDGFELDDALQLQLQLENMWFDVQHAVQGIDRVLEEDQVETTYYDGLAHVRLFTPPVDEEELYGWCDDDDDDVS